MVPGAPGGARRGALAAPIPPAASRRPVCVLASPGRRGTYDAVLLSANELQGVLLELALLFALCVGVAVTFHRFKLPPIVGFLVAGVLVGPNAIGLVQHKEMVEHLAEVGVVVLLFAVGLEVPLGQISRLKRTILVGGGLQIVGTVLATAGLAVALGLSWNAGLLLGFLVALSSTAAATKILVDQGELAAPHGRVVLGVMIAQDLAVVPMILLLPFIVGGGDGGGGSPLRSLANLGILVAVLAAARFLVGPLVRLVARTRNRELFVLFLATWCLSLAVVTAALELSLALGAFLAGVLLADSDHHSQAASETEPFRDAFASLFFVSIGMLFDGVVVVERPVAVGVGLAAVLVGKAALMMLAASRLGQPGWVQLRAALTAAQVGEFSFVLVQLAKQKNPELLSGDLERVFLVVAVLSIAVTPLLYALGKRFAARARAAGDGGAGAAAGDGGHDGHHQGLVLQHHAIVVGFGPTGRTIAAGLQAAGVPYVVAEMNANTVKAEKQKGTPIVLADCTRIAALEALGVHGANLMVLAVNDAVATSRTAQLARQLAPDLHVLARTTYTAEAEGLRRAGANDVVPQELEASVEMLARSLRRFLVADDEIDRQVRDVRAAGGSGRIAGMAPGEASDVAAFVPGIGFAVHRVQPQAACLQRTLAEVGLRKRTGCSVVAVRRGDRNLGAITPETALEVGDTVVVIGPKERLADAAAMFAAPRAGA
ncbi:MAG: sodium:proton exchanger [Planctomycetes bacterium]|nr:sodium:proton exchanger [Planctomycetota bacterium]